MELNIDTVRDNIIDSFSTILKLIEENERLRRKLFVKTMTIDNLMDVIETVDNLANAADAVCEELWPQDDGDFPALAEWGRLKYDTNAH